MSSVLLIDSCPLGREGAHKILRSCLGKGTQEIFVSADLSAALKLDCQPHLVLLMARSWLVDSIESLKQLQKRWPKSSLVLGDCDPFSDQVSREQTITYALKTGLQGYFCYQTPVEKIGEVLSAALEGDILLHHIRLYREQSSPLSQAYFSLSERERYVLKLLIQNYSNPEIAGAMNISCRTVESHKNSIRQKFGVKTAFPLIQPELANLLRLEEIT